jgi:hypothetical protein
VKNNCKYKKGLSNAHLALPALWRHLLTAGVTVNAHAQGKPISVHKVSAQECEFVMDWYFKTE